MLSDDLSSHSTVSITPERCPVLEAVCQNIPRRPAQGTRGLRELQNLEACTSSGMLKGGILWLSADPKEKLFKSIKWDFSKNDIGRQARMSIESNY